MGLLDSFEFILPTRIKFGLGVAGQLANELEALGARKVLIVTDRGIAGAGLLDRVTESLKGKVEFTVYDGVEENPKDRNVEEAAEFARRNGADCVVALGGGSPIDAAKAVCVLALQGGRAKDYKGKGKIKDKCLSLVTIPTTSGTGSEVTFSSVITDTDENYKFTIKSPAIAAKVALVDPELTLTVPPAVTASTGIDALTHAIEGYTANVTEPIAEALGLYAIELIAANLKEAVHNGNSIEARTGMMLGSLLAGLCFSHSDVGSVHCMAEALGGMYDAPHGLCNAILLPYVMEYNLPEAEYKYARIARAMGIENGDDKQAAILGIEKIRKISKDIGLPSFKSLNIREEDLEELAGMSAENISTDSNPRRIDKQGYLALFKKAYGARY
ncbi:MAG: iron-containing alcohol dehydrogenase [Clostridia bacterium]|jgi:alcohol dehydrogenase|nr:iron-containing alcohol dehydrogenase [Clostridiales bacterium]